MMGIFYAKEDTRCSKQILQLVNLSFKHSLAMRTILTPPKTMTICKLYGIYYHSALHHASVIYRLVCLLSINAGLFERFFDRIVDITRRMWSKHTEDLVLNAFLYILEEDITARKIQSIQKWEITKLIKRLPDRANTTVSKDLLTKKARLWQAQLEVISDFLLPEQTVRWHWKVDGSVEFHDGPNEATHHPENPCVFHFRSSSVNAIQTSLETA